MAASDSHMNDLAERARKANERVQASHKADEAYNADRAKFDKDLAGYRENCVSLAFEPDDVDAVKKEREAAGKKSQYFANSPAGRRLGELFFFSSPTRGPTTVVFIAS